MVVYNEEDFIDKAIDSILKQDIGNYDLEIIIVDGNSTDKTRDIVKNLIKENPLIHFIDNPDRIVPIGFNRALSICKGSIIIRLDGHAAMKSNYVNQCLKALENTGADCVGGPIVNSSDGIIGKSINIAQSSKFGVGGVLFRKKIKKGQYVDTLAFGAYNRDVFKKLGGYDEELIRNQDDEFNFRLIQSGGRIWLDPSIQSIYYPRTSLARLFNQYFQYGFFKVRVIQKRRGLASYRHAIPLIFILSLFGSYFYYLLYKIEIPLMIIVISYISLSLLESLNQLIRNLNNWISISILPIVFSTMHFAYGFGSFLGLFYYIFNWGDKEIKESYFDKTKFFNN